MKAVKSDVELNKHIIEQRAAKIKNQSLKNKLMEKLRKRKLIKKVGKASYNETERENLVEMND